MNEVYAEKRASVAFRQTSSQKNCEYGLLATAAPFSAILVAVQFPHFNTGSGSFGSITDEKNDGIAPCVSRAGCAG